MLEMPDHTVEQQSLLKTKQFKMVKSTNLEKR